MSKFPCGSCGRGVKNKAVLCNGFCNLWYHTKCINMTDTDFRSICKEKENNWKCEECKYTSSPLEQNVEITNLKEKILNLNNDSDLDLNKSLTIAAEAGTLLLEENEKLKQQIYILNNNKIKFMLENEYRIKELEDKIDVLIKEREIMERESTHKIDNIYKATQKEMQLKQNMLFQLEDDKLKLNIQLKEYEKNNQYLTSQVAALIDGKLKLEEKINELNNSIKSVVIDSAKSVSKLLTSEEASWAKARWLDDTILQSYFHSFSESPSLQYSSALLLGPLTTQILKHSTWKDAEIEMRNLRFGDYRYVLCCLNDSIDPMEGDSGSHWSLLVLDNTARLAFHFDSNSKFNEKSAQFLMSKLNFERECLINIPCIQQKNSFECGINVLVNTKLVTDGFFRSPLSKTMCLHEWFSMFINGEGDAVDNSISTFNGNNVEDVQLKKTISNNKNDQNELINNSVMGSFDGAWKKINRSHRAGYKLKTNPSTMNETVISNRFGPLTDLQPVDNCACSCTYKNVKKPKVRKTQVKLLKKNKLKNKFKVTESNKNKWQLTENDTWKSKPKETLIKNKHPTLFRTPMLYITGDSHARGMSQIITPLLRNYRVTSVIYPGASLLYVLKQLNETKNSFRKGDIVLVIGGTNNTNEGQAQEVARQMEALVKTLTAEMILTELPYLYQQPHNGYKFFEIEQFNSCLLSLSIKLEIKYFILNHLLNYEKHYKKNGLHLNQDGKEVICRSISGWLSRSLSIGSKLETIGTSAQERSVNVSSVSGAVVDDQPISLCDSDDRVSCILGEQQRVAPGHYSFSDIVMRSGDASHTKNTYNNWCNSLSFLDVNRLELPRG